MRGGFGMFQDRMQGNPTMDTNGNPPVSFAPTLYFGNLDTYADSGGADRTFRHQQPDGHQNPATTMNWSFGIQQQVKNFAIDASYVGSASYHLIGAEDINPIPIGAHFNKAYRGSVAARQAAGGQLPAAVLRLGRHQPRATAATTPTTTRCRFSAQPPLLQRPATRHRVHLLQGAGRGRRRYLRRQPVFLAALPQLRPRRLRPSAVFVANYVYDLPKVGTKMNFAPAKWVLDNWEVSGITSFISGSPFTPGLGWTTSAGVDRLRRRRPRQHRRSLRGYRHAYVLSSGSTPAWRRAPAIGPWGNPNVTMANFGNARRQRQCTGPGINNWDLSITKRFPLFREGRYVQFRTEMFNAPNHTQYSGVNTGHQLQPDHRRSDQPDLRPDQWLARVAYHRSIPKSKLLI